MNRLRLHIFDHQLKIFLEAMGALLTMKTSQVTSHSFFLLHQNHRNYLKTILHQSPKGRKCRSSQGRLIDLNDRRLSQPIMLRFITHGNLV